MNKKLAASHTRWADLARRLKPFQEGDSGLYHSALCEIQDAVKFTTQEKKRSDCLDRAEEIILKLEKGPYPSQFVEKRTE